MAYVASHDAPNLADEVRRLFEDLARRRPDRRPFVAGECSPTLDVLETEHAVEIVVDVPGIAADGLRVMVKHGVVLVVGEKDRAESPRTPMSFHLLERDFGRFARAVRVQAAIDASQTRATLAHGELRIVVPKIAERRGQEILVSIETVG